MSAKLVFLSNQNVINDELYLPHAWDLHNASNNMKSLYIRTFGYFVDVHHDAHIMIISSHLHLDNHNFSLLVDISLLGDTIYCDESGTLLNPISLHSRIGDIWMIFGNLELLDSNLILKAHILVRKKNDFSIELYRKAYNLALK